MTRSLVLRALLSFLVIISGFVSFHDIGCHRLSFCDISPECQLRTSIALKNEGRIGTVAINGKVRVLFTWRFNEEEAMKRRIRISRVIGVFGYEPADDSITWPARGSAERLLSERPGWERRCIRVVDAGRECSMEAMCHGDLAVNLMLGDDEGFAICLSASGFRISSGGRVFARCQDAMRAAEELAETRDDWSDCEFHRYSQEQANVLLQIMSTAERWGEIMLDRVFPS